MQVNVNPEDLVKVYRAENANLQHDLKIMQIKVIELSKRNEELLKQVEKVVGKVENSEETV